MRSFENYFKPMKILEYSDNVNRNFCQYFKIFKFYRICLEGLGKILGNFRKMHFNPLNAMIEARNFDAMMGCATTP